MKSSAKVARTWGSPKRRPRRTPSLPNQGVVPIVVHALCGRPEAMLVTRRHYPALQGRTRTQKVHFAKRQALYNGSAGVVFVIDSEGDLKARKKELADGRDRAYPDFPMAVGVAHPCIEAWLLADSAAIQQCFGCADTAAVPEKPEELPAPCRDAKEQPKDDLGTDRGATDLGR